MGTFMGHVLPGSFFASFGCWWTYNVFLRFHACRRATAQGGAGSRSPYINTCTFPCRCLPRLPVEACMKVSVVVIGMIGEFVTAYKGGHFTHLGNAQHMTMYFFFGLNGVMDILTHYRLPLPHASDYVSGALAFCMEGVLFLYHLHGRTPMNVQLHMFLVYVVAGNIVAILLEMYYRGSVMPALLRCYFTLLQGTWFIQAGYILYPPVGSHWDENDHGQIMIVTLIFCWHNGVVFILMLLACFLVHAQVKMLSNGALYRILHPLTSSFPNSSSAGSLSSSAIAQFSKMDSEQVRRIIDDSDEDV
ncbi:transmembrane protein 45B-like [Portunus trituberculatus]|uniref:transmembrane protein 45B-like n=1 Tax=Portunus trituberculatus TaxID=210409 RepID=UPI001E1CCF52|nr:transmembrane protein 45B-like [Portunus trituberculatus]